MPSYENIHGLYTGNATFKQGSRGTVIELPSRKDGKLKLNWITTMRKHLD